MNDSEIAPTSAVVHRGLGNPCRRRGAQRLMDSSRSRSASHASSAIRTGTGGAGKGTAFGDRGYVAVPRARFAPLGLPGCARRRNGGAHRSRYLQVHFRHGVPLRTLYAPDRIVGRLHAASHLAGPPRHHGRSGDGDNIKSASRIQISMASGNRGAPSRTASAITRSGKPPPARHEGPGWMIRAMPAT